MKTTEDKAKQIASEFFDESSGHYESLHYQILQALKEQDRDTREACAKAVLSLPWECQQDHEPDCTISRDDAHAACLNTKVV